MEDVISQLDNRINEVNSYLTFLKVAESSQIFVRSDGEERPFVDSTSFKISKANVFLILYNIIESSVRDGFLAIYQEIERNNHHYQNVTKEIQDLWVSFHYKQSFKDSATWNSYKDKASELVNLAVGRSVIKLDRNSIPISGNIDAEQIRRLCDLHGMDRVPFPPECKGGINLEIIKQQRNALAHGNISFTECGRQFSLETLALYKDDATIFLKTVLENMRAYCNACRYAA